MRKPVRTRKTRTPKTGAIRGKSKQIKLNPIESPEIFYRKVVKNPIIHTILDKLAKL